MRRSPGRSGTMSEAAAARLARAMAQVSETIPARDYEALAAKRDMLLALV